MKLATPARWLNDGDGDGDDDAAAVEMSFAPAERSFSAFSETSKM